LLSSDSATSSTLEVVASNTVPETDSCEWGLSWLLSVPLDKFGDRTSN
jgi:hypothetical protein